MSERNRNLGVSEYPELVLGERLGERALADWRRVARDEYLPLVLSGSMFLTLAWHMQEIGLGVERCPHDPENRWSLG